MTAVSCGLISLNACTGADSRLQSALVQTRILEASRSLPAYPPDCRRVEHAGVRVGEPLDLALLRTDRALGRANSRVKRCSRWYDDIKTGIERKKGD